jgi:serpin B
MRRTITTCAILLALAPGLGRAGTPDTAVAVQGNTRFALGLYGKLREQKGNLFFSPFNISTALAMTSAGARGKTLAQMEKVLHLPPAKVRHAAQGALIDRVEGLGAGKEGTTLSQASALWGQKGRRFGGEFLRLGKQHYGAALHEADFAHDPEGARRGINAWAAKATRNRIREMLGAGGVKKDTTLVLTSAIYFKGIWERQFERSSTRPATFHTGGGQANALLMSQRGQFGYTDSETVQAVELPYQDGDLSMVVLLPRRVDGLPALEKLLTPARLAGWLGGLKKREVLVSLPRFKLSATLRLNEPLSGLGMPLAFRRGADFSGIGSGELNLSAVVHKAFVDVNEEGTEATASSVVRVVARSASRPVSFRADRPFVFLIRDTHTGSILFLGRLVSPR